MKKKTKKNYKFGDALKAASPLFHAKYGKKGKYDKKGGNPKIGGEGDEPITYEEEAIAAIDECKTREKLDDVALRIEKGDVLKDNIRVKAAVEAKMKGFESAPEISSTEAEGAVVTDKEGTGTEGADVTEEGDVTVGTVEGEVGEVGAETGGKKSKKSAKKGKKSAKKGGKKAKKSAKKSRR